MPYFLMKDSADRTGTVTAIDRAAAKQIAVEQGMVMPEVLGTLPYPAAPKLNYGDGCPPFCRGRSECLNRSSCPRNYACSE